jgi:signal peptidase I
MRVAIKAVLWILVVAAVLFGIGMLFFKARSAPDDSMAPNLFRGDKFLLCYRCDIEKGDAVYCDHPDPNRKGVHIMGRVVGMEGDKVEFRQGLLRVNDAPKLVSSDGKKFQYYLGSDRQAKSLEYLVFYHPSLFGDQIDILMPLKSSGQMPAHVPEVVRRGHYFLMGDHRSLSLGWSADGKIAEGGGCNSSFCYGEVPVGNCHGVIYYIYSAADRGLSAPPSERRLEFMP